MRALNMKGKRQLNKTVCFQVGNLWPDIITLMPRVQPIRIQSQEPPLHASPILLIYPPSSPTQGEHKL